MKRLTLLVLSVAMIIASSATFAGSYPTNSEYQFNPNQTYFAWPTLSRRIVTNGDWGTKRTNSNGSTRPHRGIDIGPTKAGLKGQAVYAAQSGKVVGIFNEGYGNVVAINHDGADFNAPGTYYRTVYTHVDSILVSVGDNVSRGQKIATMSNSGTVGIHLHFEFHRIPSMTSSYNTWAVVRDVPFDPKLAYNGYLPVIQ
ncbi:M23 family metallopeptidase [Fusibacter sp. JL216-2]|uniref:M23 family metallopeptidase n=1 Tax=Fusibacter sp. JL216-2 TaxID=3071453 RepID=UPI003D34CF7E